MHKLSREQLLYYEVRRTKQFVRKLLSKVKKKNKFRKKSFRISTRQKGRYSNVKIPLPRVFSLEDNYEEVIEFINAFRKETSKKNQSVYIDFTTLEKIHADAALILGAELDRWRRLKGIKLKAKKINKWNPDIRRLLCEMGMFDLLDVNQVITTVMNSNTTQYIKFSTHNSADGLFAKNFRVSLEQALENIIPGKRYLFNGLSEAMTNVIHHAYPKDGKYEYEPIHNQWWMSGSVNKPIKCITAVFFDQGIGIPQALPSKFPMEHILDFIAKIGLVDHDASRIKAAMNLGRTSTNEINRGRGLINIRSFVANNKNARLRILSGKGEYVFHSNWNDQLIKHKHSIGGTLIQWMVYFDED